LAASGAAIPSSSPFPNLSGCFDAFLAAADRDQPLLVYCYHGNSSQGAADYFFNQGFEDVYSMDGGYEAWRLKY